MRVLGWMVAAVMLAGCASGVGSGSDSDSGDPPTDVTPSCEETLTPEGGAEAATEAPSFADLEAAWLCVYAVGETWTLDQGPAAIEDLATVEELVNALEPADMSRACTMELGPELLVTVVDASGTRGIVVDDYGCRTARVVGEPGLLMGADDMVAQLYALAGL